MAEIGSTILTGITEPQVTVAGNPPAPTSSARSNSMVHEFSANKDNSYGVTILAGTAPVTSVNASSFFYKMRALPNSGPGNVVWVRPNSADYTGTFAPSPILPGSVVLADTWRA